MTSAYRRRPVEWARVNRGRAGTITCGPRRERGADAVGVVSAVAGDEGGGGVRGGRRQARRLVLRGVHVGPGTGELFALVVEGDAGDRPARRHLRVRPAVGVVQVAGRP